MTPPENRGFFPTSTPLALGELPAPEQSTTWRSEHPTDVTLTLARLRRGRCDPTHQVVPVRSTAASASSAPGAAPVPTLAGTALWKTTLTAAGPATMLLTQVDLHTITVRAWGPGARAAGETAPQLCGADDDPSGFRPGHRLLVDLHRRHPGLRIPRSTRVLEALIPGVIEQRVVGLDATAGWRSLVNAYGSDAPGPAPTGMKVVPSPQQWRTIPSWRWRRAGIDARRARTVTAAAERAARLEQLVDLPSVEATLRLQSLAGIGAWTAVEVAQRALGDADAVSVGDHHLAGVIGHYLCGVTDEPFDDNAMLTALAPWRPHRYRVARLLQAGGYETRPRRGPRAPRQHPPRH